MARTVIQITADPSYLYALCDDGEIFRLVNHVWQPLALIPQDHRRLALNSVATAPVSFLDSQLGAD
jgi:hypothetical protein